MHRRFEMNYVWGGLFVTALGVALFGCAGNSTSTGSSATATTASGTTATGTTATATATATATSGAFGSDVARVNLPDAPSLLQYVFLTGAGRAGETETALVRNMQVQDNIATEISDLSERTLTLNLNQSQMLSTNIGMKGSPSRLFERVTLNVLNYTNATSTGSQTFNAVTNLPATLNSYIRLFNGRQVHVPMYLDPETINPVAAPGGGPDTAVFDGNWFDLINRIEGDSVAIRSYLSDYISFDVSSLPAADRPVLSQGLGSANRIFFSGDSYALGTGDPANGGPTGAPFETIFPAGQDASVIGRHSAPATLPNGGASSVTPGSYTTLNVDPTDVSTTDPVLARKITSFQGIWKPHFQQRLNPTSGALEELGYLKNMHSFEAISIPSSDDDEQQDIVFFNQTITNNANGTKSTRVTGIMWGYLNLTERKFYLFPIKNIPDSNAFTNRDGEISGDITALYTESGASTLSPQRARYFGFSFTGANGGFANTGKIVVLRR
jgi:hypothetical protein